MKLLKYIFLIVFLLNGSAILTGQELKIDFFEKQLTDITARTTGVKDLNGKVCAVVKVSLPIENCEFSGNIVGKPEFHASEYWVYMTPGSKQLQIRCPGYKTLMADLISDKSGLESGVTYRLELSGYENRIQSGVTADPGANYLILNITPKSNLLVKVDGLTQTVDNGQVMTYLKYGPHSYQVEAEGYALQEGTAVISRGDNTVVNINLESVIAGLTVESVTKGATIKINGQEKSKDRWTGQLTPGMYHIEVTMDGYYPYSETVELSQRDNKVITVPALTPMSGALNVAYKPIGAKIILDGKEVGTTPKVLYDLPIGSHNIRIEKEGYQSFIASVNISKGNTANIEGSLSLVQTNTNTLDNQSSISLLASDVEVIRKKAIEAYEQNKYNEAFPLFLSISDDLIAQNYLGLLANAYKNYTEAVNWWRRAAEQGNSRAQYHLGYMYEKGIGVEQSYSEALRWYNKSAAQGDFMGKEALKSLNKSL
ncbi:MAG: PEGA domain-containing protein [Muribaculaceae bacterium]|nr:PEGA domain-containing protein [Muribaculaceae bacterium]